MIFEELIYLKMKRVTQLKTPKTPKLPEQTKEVIEPRKNIVTYIGAILAGLSIGISATFIFMSQTSPLREEIRDTRKQYTELLKENEDLKKNKNAKFLNENLLNENTRLKNELNKKNIDYEKLKSQYVEMTAENKNLLSRINNIYQDYNKLKQKEGESIKHIENEFSKLRKKASEGSIGITSEMYTIKKQDKLKNNENKSVFINKATSFFDESIFISINNVDYNNGKVSGIVASSGYLEMIINDWIVGKSYSYNSNKNYEIRIMHIGSNYAEFLVVVK